MDQFIKTRLKFLLAVYCLLVIGGDTIQLPPEFIPEDQPANAVSRANNLKQNFLAGRDYTGIGVRVAIGDDGLIGPHIDFTGRLDQSMVSTDISDHGDQVTGVFGGAGNLNPLMEGVAPGAELMVVEGWQTIWDGADLFNNYGVRITSTSSADGCNTGYTFLARLADQQMRQKPTLMHVFSAGNSGEEDCGFGAGPGWGTITGGVKLAKNCLTVGNVNQNDELVNTSSRGPTTDGRLKPDLVAMGDGQFSTITEHDYAVFGGTSASAPGVAGVVAQLYQAANEINDISIPHAALIKASLLNTAEDLGNPGPDYRYGWGRVNARRAVNVLEDHRFFEATVSDGGQVNFSITLPEIEMFKVLCYWTDYEGEAFSSKALVNDLDLHLVDPQNMVHLPLVLSSAADSAMLELPAAPGIDTLNNAEQVIIQNPLPGNYTITVDGSDVPNGPQKFFVVYELVFDHLQLTFPQGGEAFSPGDTVRVHWDATGPGPYELHISYGDGNPWEPVAMAISDKWFDWVVADHTTTLGRLRVKEGIKENYPLNTFHIYSVPEGLGVSKVCVDSMVLDWQPVEDATGYKVFMLADKYMEEVTEVAGPPFTLTGNFSQSENWFAVSAVSTDGAISRRSVAVRQIPGELNCDLVPILETIPEAEAIHIFPNPSSGLFNVIIEGSETSSAKIQIFSLEGRLIIESSTNASFETVNLQNLPKGIYLLKIVFNHQIFTQKIGLF